jgi:hypothetical protein
VVDHHIDRDLLKALPARDPSRGDAGAVQRADLESWIDVYERVWRTSGTDGLAELFSDDVTYLMSPWAQPVVGLEALRAFWDDERSSDGDEFTMRSEVVVVEGRIGVVRVEVDYVGGRRWRDLWVVTLDADGRCTTFEEWPFAPDTPDGHD